MKTNAGKLVGPSGLPRNGKAWLSEVPALPRAPWAAAVDRNLPLRWLVFDRLGRDSLRGPPMHRPADFAAEAVSCHTAL